jgi:hypothetical protein
MRAHPYDEAIARKSVKVGLTFGNTYYFAWQTVFGYRFSIPIFRIDQ